MPDIYNSPLVSICIPTYNCEKYIEKMLSSIANQTYGNIEVIIFDNCSTDNTFLLLQDYKVFSNWKISQNSKNLGALNNMSQLIKAASGKYVAIYHADDIYESDIVEKSVMILDKFPDVSLVSTLGNNIDKDGKKMSSFTLPNSFELNKPINFNLVFLEILSQKSFFLITPSIMTRSISFKDNFTFCEKYKSAADYGMWFSILQKGDLFVINEALINYRTHDEQGTFLEIKNNYSVPDCIYLYEDYAKKNKDLFWEGYLYSYYKLMLIQAIKLNNIRKFEKSQDFLKLILKKSLKYLFPWIIFFLILNFLNMRLSLSRLLRIKNKLKL